ncbi:MAG: Omp28-related outer membrane protein [candidate division WOR-3 bacterium]|nr:Omp28-related outer membrane protein [candidate division WOR-3 bacterium]MCX7757952.1 Omp28-related outer membrane protein [candidate division WOR-3 bacterium]MDW7987299.1 Omp28-related outer membrane protein [candidate division WOR-3 bacterium]
MAQISYNYPNQTAVIEMHISSAYPLYSAKARNRMLYLNPGTNYTPWLFMDGYSSGSNYSGWLSLILARAAVPSPIATRISGTYNPQNRSGTISLSLQSETTATLQARVLFVITEDSIFYQAPNGDNLHNHVARDYIPDHIGTLIELRDTLTVSYPFTIASNWVAEKCEIVAIVQNSVAVNNTREVFQGAKIKVRDLAIVGLEEAPSAVSLCSIIKQRSFIVNNNIVEFIINLPDNTFYNLKIIDISGKTVLTKERLARGKTELVQLSLPENLKSGVYFYSLETNTSFKLQTEPRGKFIVMKN